MLSCHFSALARKLESTSSRPAMAVQILEKMIDSGLHNRAPPPKEDIISLLSFMGKHVANVMVQVKALEVLTVLAANKESTMLISKAGGARIVTEVMRKNPDNVKVQELGCALLVNMALVAKARVKKAGGIQVLLHAMEHFLEHASIQTSACKAISASIGSKAQADGFSPFAVIETLLKVMEAYPHNAEVQEACCEALAKVSVPDNVARSIAKRRVIDLVISAMKRHAHQASIQQHSCRVLFHLGVPADQTQVIRDVLADVGGVTPFLRALQLHTDHEMVQQHGYEALSVLANDKGLSNEAFCDLIKQEHDVVFVMNAMKKYIGNERLQFACLRVIMDLCPEDVQITRAITKGGIVKLTFAALREHPNCALLQSEGLYALSSLAKCSDKLRARIVSEGGIDSVLNAMRHHERHDRVQMTGCSLFNTFGRDPLNCALIVVAGGIECVSRAMELHKDKADIYEEGDKFLSLTRNTGVSVLSAAAAAA